MMRTGASRVLLRPFTCGRQTAPGLRFSHVPVASFSKPSLGSTGLNVKRTESLALAAYRPKMSLMRTYASAAYPGTTQSLEKEQQFAQKKIDDHPERLSSNADIKAGEQEEDVDMMAGIRHDMVKHFP